jgi:hypothetical protein
MKKVRHSAMGRDLECGSLLPLSHAHAAGTAKGSGTGRFRRPAGRPNPRKARASSRTPKITVFDNFIRLRTGGGEE